MGGWVGGVLTPEDEVSVLGPDVGGWLVVQDVGVLE